MKKNNFRPSCPKEDKNLDTVSQICILSQPEFAFALKLCQPEPFKPTVDEIVMLEIFKALGIARERKNGRVELTEYGADCLIATRELVKIIEKEKEGK